MPYTEAELEHLIETLTRHLRYKLLRNTHKSHWSTKDDAYHRRRLLEELQEQDIAIEHETTEAVWHEAEDIAAFAAFRAVRCEKDRHETQR